ncbi:MAG: hypothetical protein GF401_14935 [Chitinivibrionales bacterium]|nr:hypothetical protein [Chitinivibrionales bacterium]
MTIESYKIECIWFPSFRRKPESSPSVTDGCRIKAINYVDFNILIKVVAVAISCFAFMCQHQSEAGLSRELLWACHKPWTGDYERVAKLVKKGADVNIVDKTIERGMTPFLYACRGIDKEHRKFKSEADRIENETESIKIVKYLVEKGANKHAISIDSSTGIHLAAMAGKDQMIRTLASMGLDMNARNMHGATPLIVASASGRLDAVKACAENGAEINAKTDDGFTALDVARQYGTEEARQMGMSEYNEHAEIARYLESKGAVAGKE